MYWFGRRGFTRFPAAVAGALVTAALVLSSLACTRPPAEPAVVTPDAASRGAQANTSEVERPVTGVIRDGSPAAVRRDTMRAVVPPARDGQTALQTRLQAITNDAVRSGLTGVSLAVYHPREGLLRVAAGKADAEGGPALTPSDVSRIASVSKVFAGVVALQLVDENKIALDDPIARYISPEHAERIANANSATIAQLLTHQSGILDYYNSGDFGVDQPRKMEFTIDEALRYAWGKPAEFRPGQRYSYSNTNTLLIAAMVEQVTGEGYAQAVRKRILTPLGLKDIYTEVFERVPVKIVPGHVLAVAEYRRCSATNIRAVGYPTVAWWPRPKRWSNSCAACSQTTSSSRRGPSKA